MRVQEKTQTTYPEMKQGIIFALTAYVIWGLAPIYFKMLENVPAQQIVAFRIFFSCFFMVILVSAYKGWKKIKIVFRTPKKLVWLLFASHLIGVNWFIFIWAVNNEHVLDTSLGYFINPLINILIGTLFLSERLRPIQWMAVGLTILAVLYQVWQLHAIPYISLSLATTFSIYGLIKRKIAIDAQSSMFLETLMLLPASMMLFVFIVDNPSLVMSSYSIGFWGVIAISGIITTVPLIFFSAAASRIPFSYLGLFQYIGPSLGFILAITLFDETLTIARMMTFAIIWFALLLIIYDSVKTKPSHR